MAVFLNYLLDALPAAVLRIKDGATSELCVRTCLARGVDLARHTGLNVEQLATRAASADPSERATLARLFGIFVSEYEFRAVDPATLPYADLLAEYARTTDGYLVHNYGALTCLDQLSKRLDSQGFILINDYGEVETATAKEDFEHQRFSGSTAVGVNFALLKAHFARSPAHAWVEPTEENPSIHSRLLGARASAWRPCSFSRSASARRRTRRCGPPR